MLVSGRVFPIEPSGTSMVPLLCRIMLRNLTEMNPTLEDKVIGMLQENSLREETNASGFGEM